MNYSGENKVRNWISQCQPFNPTESSVNERLVPYLYGSRWIQARNTLDTGTEHAGYRYATRSVPVSITRRICTCLFPFPHRCACLLQTVRGIRVVCIPCSNTQARIKNCQNQPSLYKTSKKQTEWRNLFMAGDVNMPTFANST